MNTLAVSSFSLREQLGTIALDYTDAEGRPARFEMPYPQLLSLSEFPQRARDEFGVDTIETVAFQFPGGLDDPEIGRFERALGTSGVHLENIAIDVGDLLAVDAAKRAVDIALIKRWIERFAAMGSTFVRVNPGSPFNPHHGNAPPAHLIAALIELGEFANARGSRLIVENHGGPSSDPVWLNALLDGTGRDACGLLLDLGNFDALLGPAMAMFASGGEGEAVDPMALFADIDLSSLYDGITALAPRAELVSVKSHVVSDDGQVGFVDLDRALGILFAAGYDGTLTVEYEGNGGDPWAKSARVLEVTRELVAAKGSAR